MGPTCSSCNWSLANVPDAAFCPRCGVLVQTQCKQCGYDRAGLSGRVPCPECGVVPIPPAPPATRVFLNQRDPEALKRLARGARCFAIVPAALVGALIAGPAALAAIFLSSSPVAYVLGLLGVACVLTKLVCVVAGAVLTTFWQGDAGRTESQRLTDTMHVVVAGLVVGVWLLPLLGSGNLLGGSSESLFRMAAIAMVAHHALCIVRIGLFEAMLDAPRPTHFQGKLLLGLVPFWGGVLVGAPFVMLLALAVVAIVMEMHVWLRFAKLVDTIARQR